MSRTVSALKEDLEGAHDELGKKEYTIQSLKDQLNRASGDRPTGISDEELLDLVSRDSPPSPLECLVILEKIYGDRCIVVQRQGAVRKKRATS